MESGVIMSKKKKSREQSTPEKEPIVQNDNSILLPILYALLAAVGAFTVVMAAGIAITAANHSSQVLAESTPPAPVQTTYEGIYQSSYTYYRDLAAAREAAKTAEATPPVIQSSEPTQEPQAPAPSTKPTAQATSTTTPQPTARATANPTTAPPIAPTSSQNSGANSTQNGESENETGQGSGFDTGKYDRPNWPEGQFLCSSQSNKYHRTNCSRGAARIQPENEIWFSSEEEAIAAGYERCGICWR